MVKGPISLKNHKGNQMPEKPRNINKIVILDTSKNSAQDIVLGLNRSGYTASSLSSGFQMLHSFDSGEVPDLLILNDNLEDMTSGEVISLIRDSLSYPKIPILLITDEAKMDRSRSDDFFNLVNIILDFKYSVSDLLNSIEEIEKNPVFELDNLAA